MTTGPSPAELESWFNQALTQFQKGAYREAEPLFRAILQSLPDHPESNSLLGMIILQSGNPALAESHIGKALRHRPDHPGFHIHMNFVRQAQGRPEEAVACLEQAMERDANNIEAPFVLGQLMHALNRLPESIDAFTKARALLPNHPEIHNHLGVSLVLNGQRDEAIESFQTALRLHPDFPDALGNLGAAYRESGRLDEAASCLEKVIALQPTMMQGHANLAGILKDKGDLEGAEIHFAEASRLDPHNVDLLNHWGMTLRSLDRLDDALKRFQESLALKPDHAETHTHMGIALKTQGRLDAAEASYRKAIDLKPDLAMAHRFLGILLLTQERTDEGWAEYEWRWKTADGRKSRINPPQPELTPERIAGRSVLLWSEQGFGDALQFVRYAAVLKARGADRVVVKTVPQLARLFEGADGVDQSLPADSSFPEVDCHAPMMSLPHILKTDPAGESFPSPYITVPDAAVQQWRNLHPAGDEALRVGLVWSGKPSQISNIFRSLPVESLNPLFHVPSVRFVSLQMGDLPAPEPPLDNWAADFGDFTDTAAAMMNLDLIISIDTAPAHLAGALGRPVWTLLHADPDWRWGLEGESCSWYPTMRLFRQKRLGDWDEVIERVARKLAAFQG